MTALRSSRRAAATSSSTRWRCGATSASSTASQPTRASPRCYTAATAMSCGCRRAGGARWCSTLLRAASPDGSLLLLLLLRHSGQRDFGVYLVNVFDTGQAARVLALPSFGLAYLLQASIPGSLWRLRGLLSHCVSTRRLPRPSSPAPGPRWRHSGQAVPDGRLARAAPAAAPPALRARGHALPPRRVRPRQERAH